MFFAVDSNGSRIYAGDTVKHTDCYCPVCGEPVTHKIGKIKKPHFSHKVNTDCYLNRDKDRLTEWHIRMQEYFPLETREIRFKDDETGEVHIADVFLPDSNTVLEFQHSPITEEEFWSRTIFHLKNKRRIAWLFDESIANQKSQNFGRFKGYDVGIFGWPYDEKFSFKWQRAPRRFLSKRPDIFRLKQLYSVCIYSGTEGDVFHRIADADYPFNVVAFSLHSIQMSNNTDVEEFFRLESYWQNEEPWKTLFEKKRIEILKRERYYESLRNQFDPLRIPKRRSPRL